MAWRGTITEYICQTILDLSRKVAENLCANYDTLKKEVLDIMGGKILEYEAKTILNEGKQQGWVLGRESGRTETYLELVRDGLLNITDAAKRIPMDENKLQELLNETDR